MLAENFRLRSHVRRDGIDVLFSPANFAAPLLPSRVPQVVTVHDLQHVALPHNFAALKRYGREALFRASFKRVRHVIAVSDSVRDGLLRRYRIDADKVTTIRHGWDPDVRRDLSSEARTRSEFSLGRPFFYYPATDNPHKNHITVVDAFHRLMSSGHDPGFDIVFTGKRTERFKSVEDRIAKLGLEDRIRDLGYVERETVFDLMYMAVGLVFPSRFEGFGLPLLEAMQCGTAIIASNGASIPEVVGKAAILIPADATEQWAETMEAVFRSPEVRTELGRLGRANLSRFSWHLTADRTLAILGQSVGG
jgi:glycosyltransferase involved in cell wall biosynthesis